MQAAWLDVALAKALHAYLKSSSGASRSPPFLLAGFTRLSSSSHSKNEVDKLLQRSLKLFSADEALWDSRIATASADELAPVVAEATTAVPWAVRPAQAAVRMAVEAGPETAMDTLMVSPRSHVLHSPLTSNTQTALKLASASPRPTSSEEPESVPLDQPASAAEVYLRALATLSRDTQPPVYASRIAFYKHLSGLVALPLRFLLWAASINENPRDLPTLVYLHGLATSHRDAGVDTWLAWLQFLLKTKGAARAGAEFDRAKRVLAKRGDGERFEQEWIRMLDGDQSA